jgi:3-deoxy-D-manno-octulosonic-acid transferase
VLKSINPSLFLFTETELWPNCLSALTAKGIPTILVSGRFSSRALQRYRFFSILFQPIFQSLSLCCMQTQEDAERLIAAGVPQECVSVTGNFKVDGGLPVERPKQMDQIETIAQLNFAERLVLVAASTHRSEEAILLESYRQLRHSVPQLLLLLAPRHPQRFAEVETLLQTGGYCYCKRSQAGPPQALHSQNVEVFLLDTLGELSSFYSVAALAFVGGSLIKGPGGHSVIEPALAQIPVIFGPHTRNFDSIVHALKQSGGGIEITDVDSLCERVLPLLQDAVARRAAGRQAYAVIQHEQGTVERTLRAIRNTIWQFQNM